MWLLSVAWLVIRVGRWEPVQVVVQCDCCERFYDCPERMTMLSLSDTMYVLVGSRKSTPGPFIRQVETRAGFWELVQVAV